MKIYVVDYCNEIGRVRATEYFKHRPTARKEFNSFNKQNEKRFAVFKKASVNTSS